MRILPALHTGQDSVQSRQAPAHQAVDCTTVHRSHWRDVAEGFDRSTDGPPWGGRTVVNPETGERVVSLAAERVASGAKQWGTQQTACYAKVTRLPHVAGMAERTHETPSGDDFQGQTRDPRVGGIYFSPPDNALMLSVDERRQIQASTGQSSDLNRTLARHSPPTST